MIRAKQKVELGGHKSRLRHNSTRKGELWHERNAKTTGLVSFTDGVSGRREGVNGDQNQRVRSELATLQGSHAARIDLLALTK